MVVDSNDKVLRANIEVMQLAGIQATKKYISLDKRFFTIVYDSITNQLRTLGQFCRILKMIDNIRT